MGFWSGLGNVLKKVALPAASIVGTIATGGAAAPLTGLAAKLAAAGKVAGIAGDVAGSLAKGRETGRDKENAQTITQDQLRLAAAREFEDARMNRADLDLKRRADGRVATENNFRNSLLGALAKNMQDGSFNRPDGVPTIALSGGLRPSALGVEGRAAGEALNAQALKSLLEGEDPYVDVGEAERFAPSKLKKGGAMDTILGTIGAVGGAANRVNTELKQDEQNSFIRKLIEQAQAGADASAAPVVGLGDFRVPNIPRR